jgi:hypothetical protein
MTCTKTPYKTRSKAMRSVTNARSRGRRLYAYKCPKCKKWHLSTGDHNLSPTDYGRMKEREALD